MVPRRRDGGPHAATTAPTSCYYYRPYMLLHYCPYMLLLLLPLHAATTTAPTCCYYYRPYIPPSQPWGLPLQCGSYPCTWGPPLHVGPAPYPCMQAPRLAPQARLGVGPVASPSGQAAWLAPGAKYVPPTYLVRSTRVLSYPQLRPAPYISPTSPLHLPCISRPQVRPARPLARRHRLLLPLPRRPVGWAAGRLAGWAG